MLRKLGGILLVTFALNMSAQTSVQTDADHFAEGRIALDKYKDCPAAAKALSGVSDQGRKNPMWVYYMAKTDECLGNLNEALTYYHSYAKNRPSPEMTEKLADLRYQINKQEKEKEAASTREAEREKVRSNLEGNWRVVTCEALCGATIWLEQNEKGRVTVTLQSIDRDNANADKSYIDKEGNILSSSGAFSSGNLIFLENGWQPSRKEMHGCQFFSGGNQISYFLHISDDGMTLKGRRTTPRVTENCTTEGVSSPFDMHRDTK